MGLTEDFKESMASWPSGVAVVTTNSDGLLYGLTVASFASLSLEPPLVVACVGRSNKLPDMVRQAGCFGVSLLASDQEEAASYFAIPGREPTPNFVEVEGEWAPLDVPVVKGAMTQLACELHDVHPGGDHEILVGRAVHAVTHDRDPLVFHRRGFRQLASSG